MDRPLTFNTAKEFIPFGVLLVSITVWGVLGFASDERNNALTNQRLDNLMQERLEDKTNFNALGEKVDNLTLEVNRLANIVDRADNKGLMGQASTSKNFLTMAAPQIAAITPTPPREITYKTTITTDRTAGQSATPTTGQPKPTPTSGPQPTPILCLLGICVKS